MLVLSLVLLMFKGEHTLSYHHFIASGSDDNNTWSKETDLTQRYVGKRRNPARLPRDCLIHYNEHVRAIFAFQVYSKYLFFFFNSPYNVV